jgi:hypothetical protein
MVIKSKWMRLTQHAARMGEIINSYKLLLTKPVESYLTGLGVDGKMTVE